MLSLIDTVALSLWWTSELAARPRRRRGTDEEPGPQAAPSNWDAPDASLDSCLGGMGMALDDARLAALRVRAARELEQADAAGIAAVPRGDPRFPVALATLDDAPLVLWTRGDLHAAEHAVAIVGSRAATPHALEVAFRLGEGLARVGIAVVSGLARGVDAAAHRGAIHGDGRTIAVLGCGVDIIYPPEHASLAGRVASAGALVSELVPGTRPLPWHFPRRNRLISGLSAGVVIVEASAHSGSLITAACALDQGRTVMAVPGGVLSGRNRGAHALLKDGARMVETVDDVLEELHYVGAPSVMAAGPAAGGKAPADPVLWAMKVGEPYDVGFLCDRTGLEAVRLLTRLAELELSGWIRRAGGGRFVRLAPDVLT
jgi:DNA processing protein